jgi:hypothetical protein
MEIEEYGKMPYIWQLLTLLEDKLLDSITIAEMFNQVHETAKADRYFTPNMDRIATFNSDHLSIAAQQIYRNIQDPVVKANLIRQANLKCYAMLE